MVSHARGQAGRMTRPGRMRGCRRMGRSVLVEYEGPDATVPTLSVTHLADGVARIRLAPRGSFRPRRPWSATPPDDAFDADPVAVEQDDDGVTVRSAGLTVHASATGA